MTQDFCNIARGRELLHLQQAMWEIVNTSIAFPLFLSLSLSSLPFSLSPSLYLYLSLSPHSYIDIHTPEDMMGLVPSLLPSFPPPYIDL